ncbi:MAG: hypothetical protein AAF533_21175, partial [Acidobacteriota bacterium]
MSSTRILLLSLLVFGLTSCSPLETGREGGPPTTGSSTQPATGAKAQLALDELELLEEGTESLANHLLDLSVRARSGDASRLGDGFAPRVRAAFPETMAAAKDRFGFFSDHDWSFDAATERSREEVLAELQGLLDRHHSLEDVRFKLTGTEPGDRPGRIVGRFKSFLVGRDADGRRSWFRGKGDLAASRDESGRWSVDALVFDTAHTVRASRDLFTEVGAPAGLAHEDPTYAERTEGLRSHGAAAGDLDGDGLLDL